MSASTKLAVSVGRSRVRGPSMHRRARERGCVCVRVLTVFEKVYELLDAVCAELLSTGDIVGEEGDDEVGEERRLCIRTGPTP